MVNENARDTQFAGFAELLADELRGWELSRPGVKQIIARRAYDLVCHSVSQITGQMGDEMEAGTMKPQDCAEYVPDLTEWPEASDE